MISHERRCIFVHIPKTGGTSIEDAIWGPDHSVRTSDMLWMGGDDPRYSGWVRGYGGLQHMRAEQTREIVGPELFANYFSFTVVRNPWDRAISQFLHVRRVRPLQRVYGIDSDISLASYLEVLLDGRRDAHCQTFEQWRFVYDSNANQLVDVVCRFEDLALDFSLVADQLGISNQLPHENRSAERLSVSEYYPDDSPARELVAELYAEDISRFAYSYPG